MTTRPEKPELDLPRWLYRLLHLWFRVSYRFRVEGAENLPENGPLLFLPTDIQGFLGPIAQFFGLIPIMVMLTRTQARFVSILHEHLYAAIARRMVSRRSAIYGVRSHSAGTQALSLIDAYRALKEGGLVNINPEGDLSWDGASVGIRGGGVWLALRTAAPCVLVVPSAGIYDAWPFWERGPSLRGQVTLRYSKPFTVTDAPLEQVTDADMARVKQIFAAKVEELRFGPGGRAAWAPPPSLNGQTLAALPELRQSVPTKSRFRRVPAIKQGIGLLLYQCPICGTNDSIAHQRGLTRRNRAVCRACGTTWHVQREFGHDWRLVLTKGPTELIGLDVALSDLHAYVKNNTLLQPTAAEVDLPLAPGETALLYADKSKLIPHDGALLQRGLEDGLAPTTRTEDHIGPNSLKPLGEGGLLMTDQRLLWRQDGHSVAFEWDQVTSLHLLARNRIIVSHGAAHYGMTLGDEGAIKWLAYADIVLHGKNGNARRRVPISPY